MFDSLPDISTLLFSFPVENLTVCFLVLYDPYEFENSPKASLDIASVRIFKLAPKAPAPLVDVPTPLCN